MDKVNAPDTLEAAWSKVRSNDGVAYVDGQSLERFAAHKEIYMNELANALQEEDIIRSQSSSRYLEKR